MEGRGCILSEAEMADRVRQGLTRLGCKVFREVPCFAHSVDIVVKCPVGLIAIECKMRDWRKGLAQAKHHLLAFDYCFVCLPSRPLTDVLVSAFRGTEIGLLMYELGQDQPVKTVIEAGRSTEKWDTAEVWVTQALGEEETRERTV